MVFTVHTFNFLDEYAAAAINFKQIVISFCSKKFNLLYSPTSLVNRMARSTGASPYKEPY